MKYDSWVHHRNSIRLRDYDYSQVGYYYITLCAFRKECIFGNVQNGEMQLNEYGEIVKAEWVKTAQIRPNIELDEFIIMPNHFHGIIIITDNCRGTLQRAPTYESFGKPVSGSIPTIIRGFKSTVTKQINILRNAPQTPVWQRNYYEHVIRNDVELNETRKYVIENPLRWNNDEENPANIKEKSFTKRKR